MTENILFFLSPDQNRSVIAEAWAEKSALNNWRFKSFSWKGTNRDPLSIKAMHEVNIDLSTKNIQSINYALLGEASCIIAIYDFEHEQEPDLPANFIKKLVKWDIPDPMAAAVNELEKWAKYQEICDLIAENVKKLEMNLKPI